MAADRSRNIKVILDTNALLMPFQFHINLDSELTRLLGDYEIIIPSSVIDELSKLALSKEKPNLMKSAISLSKKYKKESVGGSGDEAVFAVACKYKGIVVTNDSELKNKLKSNGLKTISLRGRTHLVID